MFFIVHIGYKCQRIPLYAATNVEIPTFRIRHNITKTRPCDIQRFFLGCKNDNFQLICYYFFQIFAQNIYIGYTLEPPH